MTETTSKIRRAVAGEAAELTAIMHRSKAHWGYSAEFMARFHDSMVITEQDIQENEVFVLETYGVNRGFFHLKYPQNQAYAYLEDLFIEPEAIGSGYGKRLFFKVVELARAAGYDEMQLESDPNAESFYLRLGVVRIGQHESSVSGRFIPLMSYTLPE